MIGFKRLLAWLCLLVLPALLVACGGTGGDESAAPVSSGELAVGDAAPDFTLTSASGEAVTLSDYRGRPVLLFFHMAVG